MITSNIAAADPKPMLEHVRGASANDPVVRNEPPHASHNAIRLAVGDIDLKSISYSKSNGQSRFAQGGSLDVMLMPGESIRFEGTRVEEAESGSETWLGAGPTEADWIAITRSNRRIAATAVVRGETYSVVGTDRGAAVVKQVLREFGEDCAVDEYEDKIAEPNFPSSKSSGVAQSGFFAKYVPENQQVEILITYSPEAKAYYGNAFIANVDNLVASANQAYADSSVNGLIHVAGYRPISGSNGSDALMQIPDVNEDMNSYAEPFTQLGAMRNDTNADVVVHLVTRLANSGLCGSAETLFKSSAFASRHRAVVAVNCPTTDQTFTHEIGHMFGGNHDLSQYSQFPNHSTVTAWAPGAYGFTNGQQNYRTIMGANPYVGNDCTVANGCPRINRFSSASQTYGSSSPLGDYNANQVDMFNGYSDILTQEKFASSMQHVASYRSGTLPVPTPVADIESLWCSTTMHINWQSTSSSDGWYQWGRTDFPVSPSSKMLYEVNMTPQTDFTASIPKFQNSYFHVIACNGNGCSQRQSYGPVNPGAGVCP